MIRAIALACLLAITAQAETLILKADAYIDVDTGKRLTPGRGRR